MDSKEIATEINAKKINFMLTHGEQNRTGNKTTTKLQVIKLFAYVEKMKYARTILTELLKQTNQIHRF